MKKLIKTNALAVVLVSLTVLSSVRADDVRILAADFQSIDNDRWSVSVTLEHSDTGWDHYADNWRVVDGEGNILGDRVLYHPHVSEQPFTRELGDVRVPEGVTKVYIEAHDKMHGWTQIRLTVDLAKADKGHLRVMAE